jgi:predicted RNase H-like HicB family nuclease
MKQKFNATVWQEDDLFVSQCLDVDVASQGSTEVEALRNLVEALELYFEEPIPASRPRRKCKVTTIEVDVNVA